MDKSILMELRNVPLLFASNFVHSLEAAAMERDSATMDALVAGKRDRRDEMPKMPERVGVVPVVGPIFHRGAGLTYQGIVAEVRKLVRNGRVSRVILDIHSPGGTAAGAFEAAEELAELAKEKPITAFVNEQALSGAYLLAAACTERVLPKSACVGSIGVVMTHLDVSKAAEKAGFKFTHLFRGKHKVDGTPYEPLTDQAKAEFDKQMDQSMALFTSTVSRMLDLPEDKVRETEARIYTGEEAVSAGLADRVINARDLATDEAAASQGKPAPSRVAAAYAEGQRESVSRFSQIEGICARMGRPEIAADFYQRGLTVEQARYRLFDALAAEAEETEIHAHVGNPTSSTTDAQREAAMLETAVDGFNARAQGPDSVEG